MTRQPDRTWDLGLDAQLRQLRASGLTWANVGAAIGRDGACCRHRLMTTLGEPDPLVPTDAWTAELDDRVRDLRASGLSWQAVGQQVGRSKEICRRRILVTLQEPDPLDGDGVAKRRDPVEPGHPSTWGALIAGTLLEGSAYE